MSSKFNDDERQEERNRAARAFAVARDMLAHDRLRVSDECRCRIKEIETAARQRRVELREEQAMNWEDDVRDEKARLLLQKPAPALKPGASFLQGGKARKESDEELTRRAERNVEQDNERTLRKTYIVEDSLINVAVLEDLRAFEATRDAQEVERNQGASREEPGAAARESEPVRETFDRAVDHDSSGREI